jgi:hypothetical protein
VRWRDEPEPGPLRTAWEGLTTALAGLRAELARAWGYRRPTQIQRARSPALAEPELRIRAPWSADAVAPPVGAVCSHCGGSAWWSERPPDPCHGWRCDRCHPSKLGGPEIVRVNTRPVSIPARP